MGCHLKISPQDDTEDNGKGHRDTQMTNTPGALRSHGETVRL